MDGEDDIVYLDLNKVKLHCFEDRKSDLTVDSIVRGIEAGHDFPAVLVYQISNTEYALCEMEVDKDNPFPDGGHDRAAGHYIANQPLKSHIRRLPADFSIDDIRFGLLVGDIVLYDDSGDYELRKMLYGGYI
jgi:hypothetical protein